MTSAGYLEQMVQEAREAWNADCTRYRDTFPWACDKGDADAPDDSIRRVELWYYWALLRKDDLFVAEIHEPIPLESDLPWRAIPEQPEDVVCEIEGREILDFAWQDGRVDLGKHAFQFEAKDPTFGGLLRHLEGLGQTSCPPFSSWKGTLIPRLEMATPTEGSYGVPRLNVNFGPGCVLVVKTFSSAYRRVCNILRGQVMTVRVPIRALKAADVEYRVSVLSPGELMLVMPGEFISYLSLGHTVLGQRAFLEAQELGAVYAYDKLLNGEVAIPHLDLLCQAYMGREEYLQLLRGQLVVTNQAFPDGLAVVPEEPDVRVRVRRQLARLVVETNERELEDAKTRRGKRFLLKASINEKLFHYHGTSLMRRMFDITENCLLPSEAVLNSLKPRVRNKWAITVCSLYKNRRFADEARRLFKKMYPYQLEVRP